jgi:hypothetical protein
MQCIGTKSNYVSAANRFMEFRHHKDLFQNIVLVYYGFTYSCNKD